MYVSILLSPGIGVVSSLGPLQMVLLRTPGTCPLLQAFLVGVYLGVELLVTAPAYG